MKLFGLLFFLGLAVLAFGCGGNGVSDDALPTGDGGAATDFYGKVTLPGDLKVVNADIPDIKAATKGAVKYSDFSVYCPGTGTSAPVDSAGNYVFSQVPRADRYFFHCRNASGSVFLTAASARGGRCDINLESTAFEMAYSEAMMNNGMLSFDSFRTASMGIGAGMNDLQSMLDMYLSTMKNSSSAFTIKGDPGIMNKARSLASSMMGMMR